MVTAGVVVGVDAGSVSPDAVGTLASFSVAFRVCWLVKS